MIYPIDAYQMYLSIKLHFQSDTYNHKKYSGKSRISNKSFESRKDFFYFVKLSKKFSTLSELESFFIANYIYGKYNIIDLCSSDAFSIYKQWKGKMDMFHSYFIDDVMYVISHHKKFSNVFLADTPSDYPKIVSLAMQKSINLETLVILYFIFRSKFEVYGQTYNDMIWNDFFVRFQKYAELLEKLSDKKWLDLVKNCCKNATYVL